MHFSLRIKGYRLLRNATGAVWKSAQVALLLCGPQDLISHRETVGTGVIKGLIDAGDNLCIAADDGFAKRQRLRDAERQVEHLSLPIRAEDELLAPTA